MGKKKELGDYLFEELEEFYALEDTRDNIEAPPEQLSKDGKFIQAELHKMGITTKDQVDKLEKLLIYFFDQLNI